MEIKCSKNRKKKSVDFQQSTNLNYMWKNNMSEIKAKIFIDYTFVSACRLDTWT